MYVILDAAHNIMIFHVLGVRGWFSKVKQLLQLIPQGPNYFVVAKFYQNALDIVVLLYVYALPQFCNPTK